MSMSYEKWQQKFKTYEKKILAHVDVEKFIQTALF